MMPSDIVSNFFYFVVVVLRCNGKPEEKNKLKEVLLYGLHGTQSR